jgi:adenine-specific DNA-methyltransferase
MSEERIGIRYAISQGLAACAGNDLAGAATQLFETLGYRSSRSLRLRPATAASYRAQFDPGNQLDPAKALTDEWRSVQMLFQLTDEDVDNSGQLRLSFDSSTQVDNAIYESYLFFAIDLGGDSYTRTQLAVATRELNRLFPMPALLLFRHGGRLSFAVIDRRLHKRDSSRDVLEKVTLIKDIDSASPHRAHIEILHDLSLAELHRLHGVNNFVELHRAWRTVLSSSELNKRFFKEIANWYFWAVQNVTFPEGAGEDVEVRNATSVIRLITRLIFVWFLKEKGLIPDDLFNQRRLAELLHSLTSGESSYYKAILQNLFFATLNQEMNTPQKPEIRKFRGENRQHYNITNLYRYRALFREPDAALALFANIPFLNGGLFECLDKPDESGAVQRVDGFSDRPDNPLDVPNFLFFGGEKNIDLNEVYGTRGSRYTVRGLIEIFQRYKFTITENTPIEEEIALDPELLGQVFENLLAAYNPETESTARKQTGSFYTPREVVAYMVDEALVAHLSGALPTDDNGEEGDGEGDGDREERLRQLLAYTHEKPAFSPDETTALIHAIHSLKILDPACGSGAFPMGILQKLVFVLTRLDPRNERWKESQLAAVRATPDPTLRAEMEQRVEEAFAHNELDYGRKLYLIENCIYGVDIQPIAVQIAKLRFFISLVVDQALDDSRENRGIIPLPNLETKFVAANSLLPAGTGQMGLRSEDIAIWENELADVRRRHFTARTPTTKAKWRKRDGELREVIKELLLEDVFFQFLPDANTIAERLAHWDPYDQNSSADFFDPEWMFGLSEGFHILIGNPPYVRQEKIRQLKPRLQPLYPYTYSGTADLYVYFYERSHQLLVEGGVLLFITPNKYFRANYGVGLRKLLGNRMTIRRLIDFGDAPVFTAIAYPSIVAAVKAPPPPDHRLLALNWQPGPPVEEFVEIARSRSFAVAQSRLDGEGWQLETPTVLGLLDKVRAAGKPLGEYVEGRFYYGIKTGYNEAFVIDGPTKERLIAEHPSSAEVIKPFLRGRDVKRWRVDSPDLFVLYIPWDTTITDYPAILNHLRQYQSGLGTRPEVVEGRFPWYALSRYGSQYREEFEQPKIILPAISNKVEFAADYEGFYGNDKTSICVPEKVEPVLGKLNSRLIWWFITKTAAGRQGGFYEFKPMYVSQIPIASGSEDAEIESLVRDIQSRVAGDPSADVSDLEAAIDAQVYRLYGLTEDEIAIVEGATVG